MSLSIYTPESDRIVHNVRVDLTQRTMIQKPIHLIQYDDKLPIVAVSLFKDGQPYNVNAEYTAAVRWGRHMGSGCYNTVLGADPTFHIIYFEVSQVMAALSGSSEFVIELTHGNRIGATSPALTDIHPNPVYEGDIETSPEYTAIVEYVAMAEEAATRAEAAASGIEQYATDAKQYRDEAEQFKIASESARDTAKSYRDQTENLKNNAIKEVTDIKKDVADLKDETKRYRDNAQTSETNAKTSEDNAIDNATLARSWAEGGTGTRTGEDANNAKYWSDQAKAAAKGDYIPNADRGVTIAQLVDGVVPESQLKKASTTNLGILKPDGTTTKVDENGVISTIKVATGICNSPRADVEKVVTLKDFTLYNGAIIAVRFTDTGASKPTAGNISLNVNSTGAKEVLFGKSNKTKVTYSTDSEFYNNVVQVFVYDGTNWVWVNRDVDTKNTAGTTNKVNAKMFLTGATSQATSPTTYSNVNCYIGTDNELYSNGKKVAHAEDIKTVDDSMSDTSTNAVQNKVIKKYVDDTISGSIISGTTKEASLFGKEVTLTYNNKVIKKTTISALGSFSFTGVQAFGDFVISASDGTEVAKEKIKVTQWGLYECVLSFSCLYGFHINPTESDPDARVTYLSDCKNASFTPAHMNFSTSTFEYGGWAQDEFFMPKSCMLKSNGVVDYYLDENDNTKKLDGTASDVANTSYGGNAMMEWGRDGKRIYWKIVPDTDTNGGKVYICDKQLDDGFKDFNFRDANGKLIDHFYTPKYNGSLVDGKLRSLSGQSLIKSYTATQEVNYALANNPSGKQMWYIEQWVDRMLINLLLVLMCKSTNTQEKFGYGNIYYNPTSEAAMINTGTMNDKGMFFGKNSSTTHDGVKVFGMENYWGNQWRRTAGYISDKGTQKVKMTWGTNDGSATTGYNETGSGYLTVSGATPDSTSGGYISKAKFDPITGITPYNASGSETTYYADGFWFNNSQVEFACVGGNVSNGSHCGAFCVSVHVLASYANWGLGASLSCKPLAS